MTTDERTETIPDDGRAGNVRAERWTSTPLLQLCRSSKVQTQLEGETEEGNIPEGGSVFKSEALEKFLILNLLGSTWMEFSLIGWIGASKQK